MKLYHPDWYGTKRANSARMMTNADLLLHLRQELEHWRDAKPRMLDYLLNMKSFRSKCEISGYELKRLYELLGSPQENYKDGVLYTLPFDKAEKLIDAAEAMLAREKGEQASSSPPME